MTTYPTSDLDRRELLLDAMGGHWSGVWRGDGLPDSISFALGQAFLAAHDRLNEAVQSLSPATTPVWHRRRLAFLTFRLSQLNSQPLRYGEGGVYGGAPPLPTHKYGTAAQQQDYRLPLPEGLQSIGFLSNRLTQASLLYTPGVDFLVEAEQSELRLRENPFDSELVSKRPVFLDGEQVDEEIGLWAINPLYDEETPYWHFGGQFGWRPRNSVGYRDLLAAFWKSLATGFCMQSLQQMLEAMVGDAFSRMDGEIVERIATDNERLVILTDQSCYRVSPESMTLVAVGDTLAEGTPLSDTLQVFELGGGVLPPDTEITALSLDKQLLHPSLGELSFRNADVALSVEPDENGIVKVTWELEGFPTAVDAFWDEVHARGLSGGTTLARYLDRRGPDAQTEPEAAMLPATINPLQFLIDNLLRCHLTLVKIRTARSLGMGLSGGRLLRRFSNPWSLVWFVLELEAQTAPATMNTLSDGAFGGAAVAAGQAHQPPTLETSIDLNSWVTQSASIRTIGGRCY